jgi:hypothetical protein
MMIGLLVTQGIPFRSDAASDKKQGYRFKFGIWKWSKTDIFRIAFLDVNRVWRCGGCWSFHVTEFHAQIHSSSRFDTPKLFPVAC